MAESQLTVSLEPHLVDRLRVLHPALPSTLGGRLAECVSFSADSSAPPSTPVTGSIPHTLLNDLSRWTRTPEGTKALEKCGLDASDYSMIALLAGTKTSPEKHFPTPAGGWPTVAEMHAKERKREVSERQALANVVNALVSIGGCAAAVWYAAGVVGWPNEWRVLLAMLAAFVVAGAEAALYVIWTSYTAPSGRNRAQRLLDKKNEPLSEITNSDAGASASGEASTTATENNIDLRQRGPVQADL